MRRITQVACALTIVGVAACDRGTPSVAADTTAAATAAAPAAPVAAAPGGPLASSRTFNSLLGDFQFSVPDVWEQRYTATERAKAPEYPGARSVSEFMFLPVSGGTPPSLVILVQYPEAEWKKLSSGSAKPAGTVVAERGGRVFVAQVLSSNPFPAGSEDAAAIAPMMLTPEQVGLALMFE